MLNLVNNSFISNIYVGSDGKLHKVQGGADSVLPFSNSFKNIKLVENSNLNISVKAPIDYSAISIYQMAHQTAQITAMSINGENVFSKAVKDVDSSNLVRALILNHNGNSGDTVSVTRSYNYGTLGIIFLK